MNIDWYRRLEKRITDLRTVEHWLDAEERWDSEPAGETWEEEDVERGYAPWEVRIQCASHAEARDAVHPAAQPVRNDRDAVADDHRVQRRVEEEQRHGARKQDVHVRLGDEGGGPEGEHSYDEGPEAQLGRSDVRHHEDGSVTVEGEKVDDPEEFKGDPIPGGPTDNNDSS